MDTNNKLPSATRRLFLQHALLALGAAAAAPALSTQALANTASSALEIPKLSVLTLDEYRILSTIGDTIIPRGGAFPLGALDIDLAARIDSYLDPADTELMQGVRGSLMFIEQQAPAMADMEGAFTALSAEQRESLLLALRDSQSDATVAYAALRGLCLFYFYTHEDSWPSIGYDGTLVQRGRPVYPQVED